MNIRNSWRDSLIDPLLYSLLENYCLCNSSTVSCQERFGAPNYNLNSHFVLEHDKIRSDIQNEFLQYDINNVLMWPMLPLPECYGALPDSSHPSTESCQSPSDEWQIDSNTKFSEHKSKHRDMINYDVLKGHQYEIVKWATGKGGRTKTQFICRYDNCNKIFYKNWNLVYHFRIHTNERPFKCEECYKTFSQKANLERHVTTHKWSPKDKHYEGDSSGELSTVLVSPLSDTP